MQPDRQPRSNTLLACLGGVCIGVVGGWALSFSMLGRRPETRPEDSEVERAVLARLDRTDSMLHAIMARLEAGTSAETQPTALPGEAQERVAVGEHETPEPSATRAELEHLSQAIEALQSAVTQGLVPGRYPSLDMIRAAASEPNWKELDVVLQGLASGQAAEQSRMKESLRWMTQQEVLDRYGRPERIFPSGAWGYRRAQPLRNESQLTFRFVEDYVVNVELGDGPEWWGVSTGR